MTHIDSLAHDRLGELIGIDVNRLTRSASHRDEFTATPNDFVLGNGSGGWPAAVIPIAVAVETYLLHLWDLATPLDGNVPVDPWLLGPVTPEQLEAVGDSIPGAAGHEDDARWQCQSEAFSSWGGDAWAHVVSAAKTSTFGVPYDQGTHGGIEHYLICALGEYALVTGLSDLVLPAGTIPDDVRTAAAATRLFRAVAQLPTGYSR